MNQCKCPSVKFISGHYVLSIVATMQKDQLLCPPFCHLPPCKKSVVKLSLLPLPTMLHLSITTWRILPWMIFGLNIKNHLSTVKGKWQTWSSDLISLWLCLYMNILQPAWHTKSFPSKRQCAYHINSQCTSRCAPVTQMLSNLVQEHLSWLMEKRYYFLQPWRFEPHLIWYE